MKHLAKTVLTLWLLTSLSMANAILAIYPEENSLLAPDELIAIFSVDRSTMDLMNKDSVKLYFNGEDQSHLLRFTSYTITFTPDGDFLNRPDLTGDATISLIVPYAQDNLELRLADSTAETAVKAWKKDTVTVSFTLSPKSTEATDTLQRKKKFPFVHRGLVYTNQSLENGTTDSLHYLGELGASGNGYRKQFFYNYHLFLNSDEEKELQTLHRFRLTAGYGSVIRATFGDATPYMNEYILDGTRVRGVELRLSTPRKRANVDFIWGQSKRAISPYLNDAEGLQMAIEQHNSLPDSTPFTHNDSLPYWTTGSYQRNVLGTRLHFGSEKRAKYGLTLLKVRDDIESIDQLYRIDTASTPDAIDTVTSVLGSSPKDNLLIGQDLAIHLWKRRITLFSNFALSIFTDDITDGPITASELEEHFELDPGDIPFNPENLEPLIILNTSSLPLPSRKGFRNSTAFDAGFRLNIPIKNARERFEFAYQQIGSNYTSLLNESLLRNKRGFTVKEELRLFNSKLFTSLKFTYFHDNMDELKPKPTVSTGVLGLINLMVNSDVPQVNVMISTNRDKNDSPDSTQYNKENSVTIWGVGSNYTREIGDTKNTIGLHYSNNAFEASSSSLAINSSSNSHLINANVVTYFTTIPLKTRASLSNSYTDAEMDIKVINPSLGASYDLIPNRWDISSDARFYAIRNSVPNEKTTKVKRFETVLSSQFRINTKQALTLSMRGSSALNSDTDSHEREYMCKLYYEFRY